MKFAIDETHDTKRSSWVPSAVGHAVFPVQNLPFGIFSPPNGSARAGVAIGDEIFDLRTAAELGLLPQPAAETLRDSTLNRLFALDRSARRTLRLVLSRLLGGSTDNRLAPLLHPQGNCSMHLPVQVGDYSDFYVGIHHAMNVGRVFRPDTPLMPNYKHLPIGYHGRASSIRVSGVPVRRPFGQLTAPGATQPEYSPSRQLDYELELGIWIGRGNQLGERVPMSESAERIVGLCLLNDWSARDVQAWERLPLGPFLSKSFQTTISPWVIDIEALTPFRIAPAGRPTGDPAPLPYLQDADDAMTGQFALRLEVGLLTPRMREAGVPPHQLSRAHASDMYWTFAQIVTQQASNGCNMSPGDLLGTGTISGSKREASGSLLEQSRGGTEPVQLSNGEVRSFLQDGDEVIFHAFAEAQGFASIGFGTCRAKVLPAH
jgi:fumarylacetoacetase